MLVVFLDLPSFLFEVLLCAISSRLLGVLRLFPLALVGPFLIESRLMQWPFWPCLGFLPFR